MKNYYLMGYSGHAYVIAETILSHGDAIRGYFDIEEKKQNPFNLNYYGNNPAEYRHENTFFFPCVGNNEIRKKIILDLISLDLPQSIIAHKEAIVSTSAKISPSSFISANAVINAMATIKDGCIINSSATIEHDVFIDKYTHVAPGATLLGGVSIGTSSLIGANSVVLEGRHIGSNVILGAGSVALTDIPDNQTWVGNPAKRIK